MSGWTDSAIAARTKMVDRDGKRLFIIGLPDGTEFSAEIPEKPNAQTLIAWCERVREEVEFREEEKRARDARARAERKRPAGTTAQPEQAAQGTQEQVPEALPRSPRGFIEQGFLRAQERHLAALKEYEAAKTELNEWAALSRALPEEEKDVQPEAD